MARHAGLDPYAGIQRLAFDAYCMQHVESYGVSAKSYAAHLSGLCAGVERGGGRALYDAIPRWLNGHVEVARPAPPESRGARTVLDVMSAETPDAYAQAVLAWAAAVWEAYAAQHALAREWLDRALEAPPRR